MERALVTGGTGLFGASLIRRLLAEGVHVTALVRAADDDAARTRMLSVLDEQCRIENVPVPDDISDRISVVQGEITDPEGLHRGCRHLKGRLDSIWHSAACVNFVDAPQCVEVNLEGTRNVLNLARELQPALLHHVSTAYVAGGHDGVVHEDVMPPRRCNNAYESTKYDGELLVREQTDVPFVIHRPSIIVGSGRDGRIRDFKNFYLFIRFFAKASRHEGELPLRFPGTGELGLNLVPLDWCVEGAWRVSRKPVPGRTYHLVNAAPPSLRDVLASMDRILGTTCIVFAGDGAALGEEEQAAEARFREFLPYLFGSPRFDLTNITAAAGDLEPSTLDAAALDRIVGYYVAHLANKRSRRDAD